MNLEEIAANLAAQELDPRQRILVYGDSGTGKSTMVAQLAEQYKLHWFDLDHGSEVLFTAVDRKYWKNINLYNNIADVPENPRGAKLVDRILRTDRKTTFCKAHGGIAETDSLGNITASACVVCAKDKTKYQSFEVSKLTTDDVLVLDGGVTIANSAANYAIGSERMSQDMAAIKSEWDEHGKQGKLLDNFLSRMKAVPCHVVLITHPVIVDNPNGTKDTAPSFGTRNFAKPARAAFGHIVYLYMKNGKHCFTSSETHAPGVIAKSRWNVDVKQKEDIFKLLQLGILQAEPTKVSFEKDNSGGPDETQRPVVEAAPVESAPAQIAPAMSAMERLKSLS